MKMFLSIKAPEELGSNYNYETFIESEEEALAEMSDASGILIDHMIKRGPIGNPPIGCELWKLGYEDGLYEIVAPNGWVGALYQKEES